MNHRLPLTRLGLLVFLASASPGISQDFSEEDLAATIALDSGYPEEGYLGYARSLARTLSLLNPAQVEKVFKGRGPLRKSEAQAARLARQAQQETSGNTDAVRGSGE